MKRYMLHLLLVLALFISCADDSASQAGKEIAAVHMTSDSAISHSEKDTITIDFAPSRITRRIRNKSNGDLLFASYDDVLSYDGDKFTPLPHPADFEGFDAFDALEDSQGQIWIASNHYGVYKYDAGEYTHYTDSSGLTHDRTIDIYEDQSGDIWISTMGGISRYDGSTWRNYHKSDGLPTDDINRIIQDRTGLYWIATRSQACTYDGSDFTTIRTQDGKYLRNIRHIIEDQQGGIWLGGAEGLWYYRDSLYSQLSKEMMVGIHEDQHGKIWTIATHGIYRGWKAPDHSQSDTLVTQQVHFVATPGPMLFGIGEDREGVIWIGTGSGVFSYDGAQLQHYRRPDKD